MKKTKAQTKKELIETLEWVLKNLNKNTLGTIELENGVGTIVDAHLFKIQLKHAIKIAKG